MKTKFTDKELLSALDPYSKTAEELIGDETKMSEFLAKVKAWLKKAQNIPVIGSLIEDILTMVDMSADYVKGEYRDIPVTSIISVVAALAYAISPIDLIPDWIPVVGFLDDAAVISLVLRLGVGNDLQKYRKWKKDRLNQELDSIKSEISTKYVHVLGKDALVCASLDDSKKIKLVVCDCEEKELPLVSRVNIVDIEPCLSRYDLAPDDLFQFYKDVFTDDRIRWSVLGPRPLIHEYESDQYAEDYYIEMEEDEK